MAVSMDTNGHHHSDAEHHYRINSAVAAPEHDAEACGRAERSKVAGTLKPCDMQADFLVGRNPDGAKGTREGFEHKERSSPSGRVGRCERSEVHS
jgi:hypothetical protein